MSQGADGRSRFPHSFSERCPPGEVQRLSVPRKHTCSGLNRNVAPAESQKGKQWINSASFTFLYQPLSHVSIVIISGVL